ncbi:MAG: Type II secretion system protein E [Candidatus Woesebacteria bacterium GW2011_GWA1_37_8]|nr:MAG: Type II secretion system protein E [Candidatus Woesebacteria bacterium GW2011_GWA1_37_8]
MTIEDPVEYEIEGVNQVQVNEKTNLTFANGLKSLVRQDPDIMLVGEIRDTETAGISVNAALTGHLVLSTLHTNDAATSIPRLLDLGVEPFLISSTVNVIIAQRLVRKICLKCRFSRELDIEKENFSDQLSQNLDLSTLKPLFKRYAKGTKTRVYKGKGCDVCHDTGYVGRIGIFEVLLVNDEIKKAINEKKNASDIAKIAVKNGMTPMFEDGVKKMIEGVTTLEEILRVTKQ